MGAPEPARLPRWLLGSAVGLPVALVVAVLVAAAVVRSQRPGPLPLAAIPAPAAGSVECGRLLAALPQRLDGGLDRRELAAPAAPGTAAWGDPAVVLRCGLARPAELTVTSRLLVVTGVQFLAVPAPGSRVPAPGSRFPASGDREPQDVAPTSWVAVDRPVYVAVTLPTSTGSGPLQQIAEVIAQTLPARAVDLPR